jgi:hypothetical protein
VRRFAAGTPQKARRPWCSTLCVGNKSVKIVLSDEAVEKIESEKPPQLKNGVATFLYSCQPNIEEHYYRGSENVSVSFSESAEVSLNERWVLRWVDRKMVPEECIVRIEEIELFFTPVNYDEASTEAHIHFKDNRFQVSYK